MWKIIMLDATIQVLVLFHGLLTSLVYTLDTFLQLTIIFIIFLWCIICKFAAAIYSYKHMFRHAFILCMYRYKYSKWIQESEEPLIAYNISSSTMSYFWFCVQMRWQRIYPIFFLIHLFMWVCIENEIYISDDDTQ